MDDLRLISSRMAARALQVHESRVRALAGERRLGARKLGGRWLIDAGELEREIKARREPGRPLDPKNAFALLFLASNEEPNWIRSDVRSRLRRKLREETLEGYLPRLRLRARRRSLRGSEAALRAIRDDPRFIRSGVSAASHHGADISASGVVEGYYPSKLLDKLLYRFALRKVPEEQANLVIRELRDDIPIRMSVMPAAGVAADLLEAADQRTRRAGSGLLRKLRSH
jgi:hypothetical protein